jgi:hypothetical protein
MTLTYTVLSFLWIHLQTNPNTVNRCVSFTDSAGIFLADSSSDTDSSADSSATTKPTHKKTAAIKKSAAPPGVRSRVETPPQSKAPSSAVESGPMSESDGDGSKNAVITRKLTRSSSARRSKHLVGKTSDTESESGTCMISLQKLNILSLNLDRILMKTLGTYLRVGMRKIAPPYHCLL